MGYAVLADVTGHHVDELATVEYVVGAAPPFSRRLRVYVPAPGLFNPHSVNPNNVVSVIDMTCTVASVALGLKPSNGAYTDVEVLAVKFRVLRMYCPPVVGLNSIPQPPCVNAGVFAVFCMISILSPAVIGMLWATC